MCWMLGVTSRVTNGLVESPNMTHKVYIWVPLWGAFGGVGKTAGARAELRAFVGAQQFQRPPLQCGCKPLFVSLSFQTSCSGCGTYGAAIRAHSVLEISSGVPESIGLVGGYDVESVLRSNHEKLEFVGGGFVCLVWGWLVHTTFVFIMKMPVHVSLYSSWIVCLFASIILAFLGHHVP